MITDFICLNKSGSPVERDHLGVAQDKAYGMSWLFSGIKYKKNYEYSVTALVLNEDDIICVNKYRSNEKLMLINGRGDEIVELKASDALLNSVFNFDGEELNSAEIAYPALDNGKLVGFYISNKTNDFLVEFDLNKLNFGKITKTRI